MKNQIDNFIIANDLKRNGLGIEFYKDDEMIMEIYRYDTEEARTITFYRKEIDLVLIEECIAIFKKEIDWKFSKKRTN